MAATPLSASAEIFGVWKLRTAVVFWVGKIRQEKTEKERYDRVKRWFVGMFLGFLFPSFWGMILFMCDIVRSFFWLSRRQHRFWTYGCHIWLFLPLYIGHLETTYSFWKPIRLVPFHFVMHRVWYIYIYFPPLHLYHSQSLSTLKYLPQNYKKSWEKGQSSTEKCPKGMGGGYVILSQEGTGISPLPPPNTEAGPPPTRKPYKENLEDFKAMQAPKGWKIHSTNPGWRGHVTSCRLGLPKTYGGTKSIYRIWLIQRNCNDMYWLKKKMPKILVESLWSNLECQGMRSLSSNWSANHWKRLLFHWTKIDYIILDEIRHGIRTFISSRGLTYL